MNKAGVVAMVAVAFAITGCASWRGEPARPAGDLPKMVIPAGVNVAFAREGSSSADEHAILVYQEGRLVKTVHLPNVLGPQQCLGTAPVARTVELWGWNVAKKEARVLKLESMSDARYRTAKVLEPGSVFEQVAVSALVGVPGAPSPACTLP